jgi:hypothetical protein
VARTAVGEVLHDYSFVAQHYQEGPGCYEARFRELTFQLKHALRRVSRIAEPHETPSAIAA